MSWTSLLSALLLLASLTPGLAEIRFQRHPMAAAAVTVEKSPGYGAPVLADFDKDGDREGLFWYRIPARSASDTPWPRTVVTLDVLDKADDIHGGIAPRGVADLDGDGDLDIASKIWRAWPDSANAGAPHADWLENLSSRPAWGSARPGPP